MFPFFSSKNLGISLFFVLFLNSVIIFSLFLHLNTDWSQLSWQDTPHAFSVICIVVTVTALKIEGCRETTNHPIREQVFPALRI